MTWRGRGRAALVETNDYAAIITDFGQMIKLDEDVAISVFSLDLAEYCWRDWAQHDISGDYGSYEDVLKLFDEIVAEWRGSGITIHDLDRWNELRTFFLSGRRYLVSPKAKP